MMHSWRRYPGWWEKSRKRVEMSISGQHFTWSSSQRMLVVCLLIGEGSYLEWFCPFPISRRDRRLLENQTSPGFPVSQKGKHQREKEITRKLFSASEIARSPIFFCLQRQRFAKEQSRCTRVNAPNSKWGPRSFSYFCIPAKWDSERCKSNKTEILFFGPLPG